MLVNGCQDLGGFFSKYLENFIVNQIFCCASRWWDLSLRLTLLRPHRCNGITQFGDGGLCHLQHLQIRIGRVFEQPFKVIIDTGHGIRQIIQGVKARWC